MKMSETEMAKAKFAEKVAFIEKNRGMDLRMYFEMQVGPDGAQRIINQMEAFFISGFFEGVDYARK